MASSSSMVDAPWNPFASPISSRHSAADHHPVVVGVDKLSNPQIDANEHKIWRDPSCKFLSDAGVARVPAASSRTERFGFDVNVDPKVSPFSVSASKEPRVAFEGASASSDDGSIVPGSRDGSGVDVHQNTNASFCRTSTMLRTKTRSRLMDPAPQSLSGALAAEAGRSTTRSSPLPSGQLRSQLLGGSTTDEDEEETLLDEDLPADDNFKRAKFRTLTALQWASLVLIFAALVAVLAVPSLRRCSLWGIRLWKWVVLFLVVICGHMISGWGIRLLVFVMERNFLLRKRVLYFVYGVRKPVHYCLWLGLVLLVWHLLFDQKIERQTNSEAVDYVSKILICLLVATLFRLAKTIVIKSLASSFHVSTYFDRIQEALFNQYVIETLSSPPWFRSQRTRDEANHFLSDVERLQNAGAAIPADLRLLNLQQGSQNGESARSANAMRRKEIGRKQEGITIEHLHRLSQKNVSAWIMKRMMKIVRHGTLSTLHEQLVSAASMEDESTAMQIQSEREAKVAARRIFHNVAKPGQRHIYLEDLKHFLREDEALKTMGLFEGAEENKRITKKSLKNWVVNVFKERRALALSLNDTKTAVNRLHQMANVVVAVVVLAIWLLILDIAALKFFVFLSSQLLLVTFVFGNTLKMIFEAIIFLFVMHPFDVGDRCEIEGVQMIVEEMNILTTIFLRNDNQKVSYPNGVLATLPIGNIHRSPDMGDAIDFSVHVSTPVEKLALMKERIVAFIEGNTDHWYPDPTVVIKDVDDMNRLMVSIWFRHRINFQEITERWKRRELVVQEMVKVSKELEIEYRMLPLDVNLRAMPALTSTRLPSTWKACS
ncbi:hypothetical protein OPV22_021234 [Ensete ventricosum]|uniref:Mechanosensitive ion channel protein n=1 Tax=Ensete ventricosum TaxID=4639 RepID=A0AAV8QGN0_ENSVE|nr:hypothetical protein OPV22_021234 [Ensete ventricosum]